MKLLTLLLVFASFRAFAQQDFDEEVITARSHVSVYDLSCVLPQGEIDQIFTKLSKVRFWSFERAEMKHSEATTKGCNSAALNQLVLDSVVRYGFVDVKVKIIKGTAKNSRFVFGKCQRNYQEQLVIIFNHGLTLKTSLIGKLIPANDCN